MNELEEVFGKENYNDLLKQTMDQSEYSDLMEHCSNQNIDPTKLILVKKEDLKNVTFKYKPVFEKFMITGLEVAIIIKF